MVCWINSICLPQSATDEAFTLRSRKRVLQGPYDAFDLAFKEYSFVLTV